MYEISKKNYFFLISIGAIPAAIFRWQIDEIFIVNLIGCFILGVINAFPISMRYKLIFGFGFCGSLTTFSGWSLELFKLISLGLYKQFFLNSIFFVLISLLSFCLGNVITKKIINLIE